MLLLTLMLTFGVNGAVKLMFSLKRQRESQHSLIYVFLFENV